MLTRREAPCLHKRSPERAERAEMLIDDPLCGGAPPSPRGDARLHREGQGLHPRLYLVVGVLAVVAVEVQGKASVARKRAEELGEELRVESPDLLRHAA